MQELISIIVPVYQVEKYLTQCLDSILNQTYRNIEVILVNDGSTDKSGEICEDYAKKDNRITVIHQENKGSNLARSIGIENAHGEYIGFVDADDWIELDMYEELYSLMRRHQVEIVQIGMVLEETMQRRFLPSGLEGVYVNDVNLSNCSYRNMHDSDSDSIPKISPHLWNKLFKKSILEEYYITIPSEIIWGEDRTCVYGAIPFIDSIYISNKIGYHYRRHEGSLVHGEYGQVSKALDSLNLVYNHLYHLYQQHESSELLLLELMEYYRIKFTKLLPYMVPESIPLSDRIYKLPYKDLLGIKKIVIYGFGKVGVEYLDQLEEIEAIQVVAIVDKKKSGMLYKEYEIKGVNSLTELSYDRILIAIASEEVAKHIKKELIEGYSIRKDKILWFPRVSVRELLFGK